MTRIEELEQSIDKSVEKFRLEINKFKVEIEHIKALAELKESKKEKWKPTYGDEYWFRDVSGRIGVSEYCAGDCKEWLFDNVPLFPTKEACEKYWHFMDTVKEKSYEFSREDFRDDGIGKYYIYYDFEDDELHISSCCTTKCLGEPYFKTEESAKYIIDNFSEELKEYCL